MIARILFLVLGAWVIILINCAPLKIHENKHDNDHENENDSQFKHHHHPRRTKRYVGSDLGAMNFLQRFGYMNQSGDAGKLISENTFSHALMEFQRFGGLNETGILDDPTILLMNTPRCGNKDKTGPGEEARRRRRYALQGSKWRRTDLTYRISQYPSKIGLKHSDVDKEIEKAFKVWSDITPINFNPKSDGRVHIDIRFVSGEHGDGDAFDGPGSTLAHAYFPQYGGDAHFDNEEPWSIGSYSGTNIFQVAAHELGHSLGLGHSSIREALMAPYYQKYKPKFKLHQDDILAIQALYGVREDEPDTGRVNNPHIPKTTETPEVVHSGEAPDLCQDSKIDTVTRVADGSTYVFKGEHYWRIESTGLDDGYPRRIFQDWDGLPSNLDASLTWADGKTFFFKGNKYWRFKNKQMDKGYPKLISTGFAGIPDSPDAAFVWGGNGKTYFFKGNEYWRFDSKSEPPVSKKYPKPIKNWSGIPNNIDGAFRWDNGMTYFFKDNYYYRFNDVDFEIDTRAKPKFPRNTAHWWFDCQAANRKIKRRPIVPKRRGSLISNKNVTLNNPTTGGSDDWHHLHSDDNDNEPQSSKSTAWSRVGSFFSSILPL